MKTIVLHKIAEAIADYYEISKKDLFENTRRRTIVDKRAIFHFLSNKYTEYSLSEIGAFSEEFGRPAYNHATVIHNIKKSKNLMRVDKKFSVDLLHLDAYIVKNVIADRKKEQLLNRHIQLMLERWFEENNLEYLDCLARIAKILHSEQDLDVINNWIEKYEGVHQTTPTDN